MLDKLTVQTFKSWRFKPGTVSQVLVPISYEWAEFETTRIRPTRQRWAAAGERGRSPLHWAPLPQVIAKTPLPFAL